MNSKISKFIDFWNFHEIFSNKFQLTTNLRGVLSYNQQCRSSEGFEMVVKQPRSQHGYELAVICCTYTVNCLIKNAWAKFPFDNNCLTILVLVWNSNYLFACKTQSLLGLSILFDLQLFFRFNFFCFHNLCLIRDLNLLKFEYNKKQEYTEEFRDIAKGNKSKEALPAAPITLIHQRPVGEELPVCMLSLLVLFIDFDWCGVK